mgnify:FL=1
MFFCWFILLFCQLLPAIAKVGPFFFRGLGPFNLFLWLFKQNNLQFFRVSVRPWVHRSAYRIFCSWCTLIRCIPDRRASFSLVCGFCNIQSLVLVFLAKVFFSVCSIFYLCGARNRIFCKNKFSRWGSNEWRLHLGSFGRLFSVLIQNYFEFLLVLVGETKLYEVVWQGLHFWIDSKPMPIHISIFVLLSKAKWIKALGNAILFA